MADEAASTPPEPVDEAAAAAAGIRTTARWVAGAFAGIPTLAVVGALVRAPGDAGWHDGYLIAGVLLAALGALIGILAFASVLAPVGLADADISKEVMGNLPEARFKTYADLRKRLEEARDKVGNESALASDAAGDAAVAEAAATHAETAATLLDEFLKEEKDPDPVKKEEGRVARHLARELRATAGITAGAAKARAKQLELYEQILDSLESLRRGAYGLQAGYTVRKLYSDAKKLSVLAAALVAVGVIFLALAPKPKPAEAKGAPATELVTLTLTPAGQQAFGCDASTIQALKVGGDDKTPTVITLPGGKCPVRAVKFVTEDPAPLGKVEKSKVVGAE